MVGSTEHDQIEQLKVAVEHRTTIGIAVGLLAERFTLSDDDAFEFLRRCSSTQERKLYDVAVELVETRRTPGVSTVGTGTGTGTGPDAGAPSPPAEPARPVLTPATPLLARWRQTRVSSRSGVAASQPAPGASASGTSAQVSVHGGDGPGSLA